MKCSYFLFLATVIMMTYTDSAEALAMCKIDAASAACTTSCTAKWDATTSAVVYACAAMAVEVDMCVKEDTFYCMTKDDCNGDITTQQQITDVKTPCMKAMSTTAASGGGGGGGSDAATEETTSGTTIITCLPLFVLLGIASTVSKPLI